MIAQDQRRRAQRAELLDEQRRFARREEATQAGPDGTPQDNGELGLPERERLVREQRRYAAAEEAAATSEDEEQRQPVRAAARPVPNTAFTLVAGREPAPSPFRAAQRRRRKWSMAVPQDLDESNPFAKVILAARRGEFVFAEDPEPIATVPDDDHVPEPRAERPCPSAPDADGDARPGAGAHPHRRRRRRRSHRAGDGAQAIEAGTGERTPPAAGDAAPPSAASRVLRLRRGLGRELGRLQRLKAEALATIGKIERLERELADVLTDSPATRAEAAEPAGPIGEGGEETGARAARRWLRALRPSVEQAPDDVVARLDAADGALREAAPAAFRDLYRDALVALAHRDGADEVRVRHDRRPGAVLVLARRGERRYVVGALGHGAPPSNSSTDDRTWERARRA